MKSLIHRVLAVLILRCTVDAFMVMRPNSRCCTSNNMALQAIITTTRRDWCWNNLLGVAATTTLAPYTSVVVANAAEDDELDDLTMPEKEPKQDEDAMAERLRKKAELQKKMAQPRTFTDSFKAEQEKQKEYGKMSKEARREALCEELGRGC